jgi:hypothetical protein
VFPVLPGIAGYCVRVRVKLGSSGGRNERTSENTPSRDCLETRLGGLNEARDRSPAQRENTVSSSLYAGLCSLGLVPVGTFQTVSLGTSVNKMV